MSSLREDKSFEEIICFYDRDDYLPLYGWHMCQKENTIRDLKLRKFVATRDRINVEYQDNFNDKSSTNLTCRRKTFHRMAADWK